MQNHSISSLNPLDLDISEPVNSPRLTPSIVWCQVADDVSHTECIRFPSKQRAMGRARAGYRVIFPEFLPEPMFLVLAFCFFNISES